MAGITAKKLMSCPLSESRLAFIIRDADGNPCVLIGGQLPRHHVAKLAKKGAPNACCIVDLLCHYFRRATKSPGPNTGFEIFVPGRQDLLNEHSIPLAGAPISFGAFVRALLFLGLS